MKWNFKRSKPTKPPGLVGVQTTSQGIAMAYCIKLAGQEKPLIKTAAFKAAEAAVEKAQALREFVAQNQLQQTDCNFVLNYKEYRLALVDTPTVAREEMNQALQWLATEAIDFPMEEAVLDSFEVPLPRARDSRKVCYLTAVQRSIIAPIKESITGAGLNLKYIDIPELILRNLAFQKPADLKGQLVIQFMPTGGRLLACREGNIYLVRNLDLNLEKLMKGMPSDNVDGILEEIALEIQRFLDFCQSYFRQPIVQSILLLPSQLNESLIQKSLQSALGLEIVVLDIAQHLNFEQPVLLDNPLEMLIAIGAALRGTEKEEFSVHDTANQSISSSS